MVAFPNAKINLGLYITEKRPDGYHNLATVFYPVPLTDSLEILPQLSPEQKSPAIPASILQKIQQPPDGLGDKSEAATEFLTTATTIVPGTHQRILYSQSGLEILGDIQNNLCIKAYQLLRQDFPDLPAIQLHLHKNIPSGAGMGGGSSDAAFTIQMLNDLFKLRLTTQQQMTYAAQLGSDCAFFLMNQPALGTGRGEILQPINLDLTAYTLLLVHPQIHVPTAAAFANIKPAPMEQDKLLQTLTRPVETWKDQLHNQFEPTVFAAYPAISQLKQDLYAAGAVYASMTGSGSTVFGLFEKSIELSTLAFPSDYLIFKCAL